MMYDSSNPFLNGNYAPWREEGDEFDLLVDGEIPRSSTARSIASGPIRIIRRAGAITGSMATG